MFFSLQKTPYFTIRFRTLCDVAFVFLVILCCWTTRSVIVGSHCPKVSKQHALFKQPEILAKISCGFNYICINMKAKVCLVCSIE